MMASAGVIAATLRPMGVVEFLSIVLPAGFWPLAVLLIAFTQRHAVSKLIGRIRSGEVFGQKFNASAPEDLEDAVEGGTDSPEVQRVIAEAQAKPSVRAEPTADSDPRNAEVAAMAESQETERRLLLEQLATAEKADKARRREEIEQVMRTAARWGAELALAHSDLAPNELDPVIEWQPDGEPHIFARSRRPSSTRQWAEVRNLRRALEGAKAELADLRVEYDAMGMSLLLADGGEDRRLTDYQALDSQLHDMERRVADVAQKLQQAEHRESAYKIGTGQVV
jgi:hypothetical protein